MNNFLTLVNFELKKIFTPKKTSITIISILLLITLIFILEINNGVKYHEIQNSQLKYTGAVDSDIFIIASERANQIRETPDSLNDPSIREEFNSYGDVEFYINLNETRQNYFEFADTLVLGDTISISLLEEFIATYLPLLMVFLISFFLSPVFSQEIYYKTDKIIKSSKYGKNILLLAKFLTTFIVTSIIYLFVVSFYFMLAISQFGMFDINASFVATVPDSFIYLNSPLDFKMGEFFIVLITLSYISSLILGLFTIFLSAKLQKSLSASMVSLMSVMIPYVILRSFKFAYNDMWCILKFNFADLISVRGLFSQFYGFAIRDNIISIVDLLPISLIIISITFISLTIREYIIVN